MQAAAEPLSPNRRRYETAPSLVIPGRALHLYLHRGVYRGASVLGGDATTL